MADNKSMSYRRVIRKLRDDSERDRQLELAIALSEAADKVDKSWGSKELDKAVSDLRAANKTFKEKLT